MIATLEHSKVLTSGIPSTVEEAIADIEASERDIDAGFGASWTTVRKMIKERIHSYAGQVYG